MMSGLSIWMFSFWSEALWTSTVSEPGESMVVYKRDALGRGLGGGGLRGIHRIVISLGESAARRGLNGQLSGGNSEEWITASVTGLFAGKDFGWSLSAVHSALGTARSELTYLRAERRRGAKTLGGASRFNYRAELTGEGSCAMRIGAGQGLQVHY